MISHSLKETHMVMKFIYSLLIIFMPWHSFAGFSADTLIKTLSGYVPIESISVGDKVHCCADGHINKVIHKSSNSAKESICIAIEGIKDPIVVSTDHYLYLLVEKKWEAARNLQVGQCLLSNIHGNVKIQDKYVLDNEIELYDISVEKCHSYFVTEHALFVHNCIPLVITLGWMFGGSAVEFGGASLGIAALGGLIGLKIYADKEKEKYAIDFTVLDSIDDGLCYANQNNKSTDAQAPGKPTEQDGYEPPKNWDGKKVRHPKTGQYGYPDRKGNIWVPTGPGPLAHGGPHWDVVDRDGKRSKNVMPGGNIRGEK